MRGAIVGFVAGAAILQTQAELPEARVVGACVAVALLLCGLAPRLTALLSGALLGFCWAAWMAYNALIPQLAARDEGVDIHLTGTIDSLPYQFADGVRFNFVVENASGSAAPGLCRIVEPSKDFFLVRMTSDYTGRTCPANA